MIQVGCPSRETNSNIREGLQNNITWVFLQKKDINPTVCRSEFYLLMYYSPSGSRFTYLYGLLKTQKELLFYLVHERSKCQCTISTSPSNNNISSKLQCSHNRKSSVLEKRMKNLNEKEILDNTLKQKNEISLNVHCQCHNSQTSIKKPLKHPVIEVSKLLSVKYSQ